MKNKVILTLSFLSLLTSCDFIQINTTTTNNDSASNKTDDKKDSNNSSNIDSSIENYDDPVKEDPYVNVDVDKFYRNYTPAISLNDANFRSKHFLLSGSIESISSKPVVASSQPMSNNKYVKNSSNNLFYNNTIYRMCDSKGNFVKNIYKTGAYITLDEVACYVFAFCQSPTNWTNKKDTSLLYDDKYSPWGEYLRLNDNPYLLNVEKYPYEPLFPNYETYKYYEMDFATTTSYKDPLNKTISEYNNGSKITRGTCRLVYSKSTNNNQKIDINNRYVFYTYNHYNDFQEYLNYSCGWGKRFGNMTGGGPYNSSSPNYKTEYPEVVLKNLV